ncbi:MAG TPA: L-serine ammonia-lyase [Candidatus Krumholzibacteria bacterium]|nr:L-serine ammonia-lyase [Candidatus Krumholzibacteria bacterium]HPD72490.1 L-serine ammonia-lyase [Candidatus Krumholzibacteria bacterium]HRY40578.1 L-serine ammonia-lyase [Candidatus Krumholzibacteria bacterium]
MDSIREIYRIGHGPSSSHTMGPARAAAQFSARHSGAARVIVHLYGALASTGRGHLTDVVLRETLGAARTTVAWHPGELLPCHTNGMVFEAFDAAGAPLESWTVYSPGGGAIRDEEHWESAPPRVYPLTCMDDILAWAADEGASFWEFVAEHEGPAIWDFLTEVWRVMQDAIARGTEAEGRLPGTLNLARKAAAYRIKAANSGEYLEESGRIFAYALAVAEENAAGGRVVTAPTCGSCGVVPAVLRFLQDHYAFSNQRILRALATAGLIGNLVKENASISGAEVGCQGEVGTACAMAAAAAAQLLGGSVAQIEYAAEAGIEHHLGLTCDPVEGYVQIPCIERNSVAASRALQSASFAILSDGRHRISFDEVVATMKDTGADMQAAYKETSRSGLAKHWHESEQRTRASTRE